jgi:catechol 2,3-dioxygenase-like lactoylglutathione lyase family enzyme
MRLNHLDLPVPNVAEARNFFVELLGFVHVETLGSEGLSILHDEGGLTLVLSRRRRTGAQTFPDTFHIGFHLESSEDVSAAYDRLNGAGYAEGPPTLQRGAFSFYCTGPGEVMVEVAYRPPRT